MIDLETKIHDKFTLEFKVGFPPCLLLREQHGHEMNLGPHFVVLLGWLLLELDVGHQRWLRRQSRLLSFRIIRGTSNEMVPKSRVSSPTSRWVLE